MIRNGITSFAAALAVASCGPGIADDPSATLCSEQLTANGLIAHWKLDELTGTQTPDAQGTHVGTVSGATLVTNGRVNRSFSFDGTDDKVTAAFNVDLNVSYLTAAAWIKWSATNGFEQRVLERSTGSSGTQALFNLKVLSASSKVVTELLISGSAQSLTSDDTVAFGQWLHIAVTYDGATIRLYINGTEKKALSVSGVISSSGITQGLGIGNQAERNRPFSGEIDDVRIYNRALSAADVSALAGCTL